MPPKIASFDGGPSPSALLSISAAGALLGGFVCAFMAWTLRFWSVWPVAVVCLLVAVSFASRWRIVVDRKARVVTRESRLFGRWRLWSSRRPVRDFEAIGYRRIDKDQADSCETVWVGLLRRNGGRFWTVGYFGAGELNPGASADYLALELAEATGLKIRGKGADPASSSPPVRGGPWFYPLTKPRNYRFPRRDL